MSAVPMSHIGILYVCVCVFFFFFFLYDSIYIIINIESEFTLLAVQKKSLKIVDDEINSTFEYLV